MLSNHFMIHDMYFLPYRDQVSFSPIMKYARQQHEIAFSLFIACGVKDNKKQWLCATLKVWYVIYKYRQTFPMEEFLCRKIKYICRYTFLAL